MARRTFAGLTLFASFLATCRHAPTESEVSAIANGADASSVASALPAPPDAGSEATPDAGSDAAVFTLPPMPRPDDPMEKVYSHQLDFSHGAPIVRVRIMEGQKEVRFSALGRMRLVAHGGLEKTLEAPPGTEWSVVITHGQPADLTYRVQVADHRFPDVAELEADRQLWEGRGFHTHTSVLGGTYGIAGRVLDTREHVLFLGEPTTLEQARDLLKDLHRRFGYQGVLFEEIRNRPKGNLEVRDARGAVLIVAQDLVTASVVEGHGFRVRDVEHDVGFAAHGREDRSYAGDLYFVADRSGQLAVANALPLEEYVRGVVPSEIYASAHVEALKAQAVTARGEVLAKIGHRHLADPYLLCAEQHCQVDKGESGTAPSTDSAIAQTRGEALFGADGGGLVPSQYSAVCGGYTEDNDNVWPVAADPSLRGQSDLIDPKREVKLTEAELPKFLAETKTAYCAVSSFSRPEKFRWERRFSAAQLDGLVKDLNVGHVLAIGVPSRGVSGRARVLTISGETGANQIRGELNIRKRFDNLKSSMLVIQPERDAKGNILEWIFRGGGWGHGVGMCQLGAIGRAEHGQTYREILRHYYNGAEVVKIY
jgi:stage II sporulation protein D